MKILNKIYNLLFPKPESKICSECNEEMEWIYKDLHICINCSAETQAEIKEKKENQLAEKIAQNVVDKLQSK